MIDEDFQDLVVDPMGFGQFDDRPNCLTSSFCCRGPGVFPEYHWEDVSGRLGLRARFVFIT
jgi:hypothetical protein